MAGAGEDRAGREPWATTLGRLWRAYVEEVCRPSADLDIEISEGEDLEPGRKSAVHAPGGQRRAVRLVSAAPVPVFRKLLEPKA